MSTQEPTDPSRAGRAADPAAASDPASWTLRPATPDDAEQIAFAELELFPDEAWTVFQLAAEIGHRDRRYVMAVDERDGNELLGYAGIMLAGDLADLHTIGSRRPGEGIGRALLTWCEQAARTGGAERLLLEVREDNERARAFYAAAGYREIDRRRGYYRIRGRAVDALVMERELPARTT